PISSITDPSVLRSVSVYRGVLRWARYELILQHRLLKKIMTRKKSSALTSVQDSSSGKEFTIMLKRLLLSLCLITLVPVAACAQEDTNKTETTAAKAQPAQVIAVVDIQQLLLVSKAAKSIQESAETARAKYQKDVKKIEQSLKDKEAAILKDREKLTKE